MVAAIYLVAAFSRRRCDALAFLVVGEQFTQARAKSISISPPMDSRPYPLDKLL
jgi:hypothetical protein